MMTEDAAKVLLSGEYSRRRGYLSRALVTWQQVAVMGTAAIWALLLKPASLGIGCPPLGGEGIVKYNVALASAVSSLLIGVWRLYSRMLDGAIVNMYPMFYLSERILVPGPACTFHAPKGVKELTQTQAKGPLDWTKLVRNVEFGHRLHRGTDIIAWLVIGTFFALSVWVGLQQGAIAVASPFLEIDATLTILLSLTLTGAAIILFSWLNWRCKTHAWPTPARETSGGAGC